MTSLSWTCHVFRDLLIMFNLIFHKSHSSYLVFVLNFTPHSSDYESFSKNQGKVHGFDEVIGSIFLFLSDYLD